MDLEQACQEAFDEQVSKYDPSLDDIRYLIQEEVRNNRKQRINTHQAIEWGLKYHEIKTIMNISTSLDQIQGELLAIRTAIYDTGDE
jgi:hypothetical protein